MGWQRRVRLLIVVVAIAFAVVLAFAFRPRPPQSLLLPIGQSDPKAVVESEGGRTIRARGAREDVRIAYERSLTYPDGSTKLDTVTITTERAGGRTFVVRGQQAEVGRDEARMVLTGDVVLTASDGLELLTERAAYNQNDGLVRADEAVAFRRGRMEGSGVGMIVDQARDTVTLMSQVAVRVLPESDQTGPTDIRSDSATFARTDHVIRFEGGMSAERAGQTMRSNLGIAYLTADDDRLNRLELRGGSTITAAPGKAGGLESMAGRDIDLTYMADGQTLERARIDGAAVLRLAGEGPTGAQRQISGSTIDLTLAADGSTLVALVARRNVQFTLPGEGAASRVVRAQSFESRGDPQRGLTTGVFAGDVQYRERGAGPERVAQSAALDVALGPGMGSIEEARFSRNVRFEQGGLLATAALARYVLGPGTLELSGVDQAERRPHLVNDRLTVDAARIAVVLEGPNVSASGLVASELKPAKENTDGRGPKVPSMLEADQPLAVTADNLVYDAETAVALYTGSAQLWQGDTSVKGATIQLEEQSGDLAAGSTSSGVVTTTTMLEERAKDGTVTRARSVSTSKEFRYREAERRAIYTGSAHVSGPQGDMTAERIELYLTPSGDELDRAEGYDAVTLREKNRKTTGNRMTYFGADDRYVVTGAPVKIVDECGRETTGRTLTFFQATDRIVVDGNEQMRTQTRSGGSKCP